MGVRVSSSSPLKSFIIIHLAEIAQLVEHNLAAKKNEVFNLGKEFYQDEYNAEIAQLVEHNLAKVGVAGPSPVFRS